MQAALWTGPEAECASSRWVRQTPKMKPGPTSISQKENTSGGFSLLCAKATAVNKMGKAPALLELPFVRNTLLTDKSRVVLRRGFSLFPFLVLRL